MIEVGDDVQSVAFSASKLIGCLTVDDLSCAGQKSGINFLCRFLAKVCASARLLSCFSSFRYASDRGDLFDEEVAIIHIIRKEIRWIQIVSRRLFRHWFAPWCNTLHYTVCTADGINKNNESFAGFKTGVVAFFGSG